MPFPEDRMPIQVRAAFGADANAAPSTWTWTDITQDVNSQQVTITRGQPDEGAEPTPTSISLVLDNIHGNYTPDNPLGDYYPNVDQGVPLEFSVQAGPSYLALDGTGQASTPDAAALDITGDLDIRLDATLDAWRGQSSLMELAGRDVPAGNQRSWSLYLWIDSRITFRWTPDGANVLQRLSTAPVPTPAEGRQAIRVVLDVDNGAGGHTVRFYTAPTLAGPWTQLGNPVTNAGVTSVFAGTAPLVVGDMGGLGFELPTGRIHGFELRNGIDGPPVANPDFTAQKPGTTVFTDSAGRTWTVSGGAALSNWHQRFLGHIDTWSPVWPYGDLSRRNNDGAVDYAGESQVTVTASGILRRLGQGEEPLQSTLRRRIPSGNPLAYWPMEDGREATQFSSPIPGVRPLQTSGMNLAADDSLAGSSPLPTLQGGAVLSGSVPTPSGSFTQWHTEFVFFVPNNGPATPRTVLQWLGTGTVRRWQLMLAANGSRVFGYDINGDEVTSSLLDLTGLGVFNAWCRWQLFAVQNGGNVDWSLRFIPIGGQGTGLVTTSYAGTVGRIAGVRGADNGVSSDLDGVALGHLAVFANADIGIYNSADTGFDGESAGARLIRLCQEESIPFALSGNSADTERMGPQRPAVLTDLLAECSAVDGGMLGEQRAAFGLQYRTRASMYNQAPSLVLNARNNEITNPFAPVLDDQQLRNAVTVSREGGSSATVADEVSIARRRRYGTSVTVNANNDSQLPGLAGWRLHLGTWPGMRYPSVSAELSIAPQLIANWLTLDYGDRLQVNNLPPQHPSDAVDLLLQGYSETISPTLWTITGNCNPAGPWTVGVVGDTSLGRVDTDGSELGAPVGADDQTLTVLVTDGAAWIAATPFDVQVGGEVMTVTAVTGAVSPQIMHVVRSVNGVTKAHTAGTPVRLARPSVVAL